MQKRAAVGGETGANGEWYRGGEFIATSENTVKGGRLEERPIDPDFARKCQEMRAQAARVAEWSESRRLVLAPVISALTANPGIVSDSVWRRMVEDHAAGFLPSLGRTLEVEGTLSIRRAECAVKAILGRRKKANATEWDSMLSLLTESL
jgi:hypothetical protein